MGSDVERRLFLIGGTGHGIVDRVAEPFVAASGGEGATIALLLAGGEGWERHVPQYAEPCEARGVRRVEVVVPGESGRLDLIEVGRQLGEATGIFIGGGHTARYHELYATEPLRSLIGSGMSRARRSRVCRPERWSRRRCAS